MPGGRLRRRRGFFALEGGGNRLTQGESLDVLRGPVGAHIVAGRAPDFLGVGFEKDFKQALAETVGDPLREGLLRLDRLEPRLEITQEDTDRLERPQLLVEAPVQVLTQEFENLPSGVGLEPGRITVTFEQPQQALEKLLALAMAISNDFDHFERQVRSAHV